MKRARKPERRAELKAQLTPPPAPESLQYLFSIHRRIRRRKRSNGFGPPAIELADIDAFIRLTGTRLSPWEVQILEDLDDLFLSEQSKPSA